MPSATADRAAARRVLDALLGLAASATTPLLPADYLELVDPVRFGPVLRGRVVARRQETADAVTLVLRPGPGWRSHVPGQYVRVGVDLDGVRQWRAYSLTSPVDAPDGTIAITVTRIGRVSGHLVDELAVGDVVHLDEATGDFVMPAALPAKVLFLTAGSGITPVMGMLRGHGTALADVHVVHCAPTADAVLFGVELAELAGRGEISYTPWLTADRGRLSLADPAALDALVPDWRDRETWACGPSDFLDAAEQLFAAEGAVLHTERFTVPLAATGEGGTATYVRSGVAVELDGATPLLDAGEAAGVLLPSGCRMGICFGCQTRLLDGAVRDLRTGEVVVADATAEVLVQTCVSGAAGPCTLDA